MHQVSLSKERVAAAGLEGKGDKDRVRVHLMDYRSMPPEWEHSFDRVVSIEMVEAVGREFYDVSRQPELHFVIICSEATALRRCTSSRLIGH